jgi:AcrR family transcriptional regulator
MESEREAPMRGKRETRAERRTERERRPPSEARREKLHDATREEIKEAALRQIAEHGVPALSLRAIARDIGMTAPALYRYFPDRAALVTALVTDAFSSFADALDAGRSSRPPGDHPGRFLAISRAYRSWAITNPQRYILIFGTPVPGYSPPKEAGPVSARSFSILVEVLSDAHKAGSLRPTPALPELPAGLISRLEYLGSGENPPIVPEVIHLALSCWTAIHGMVSLELYGLLPGFLEDQVESFIESITRRSEQVFGLVKEETHEGIDH